MRVYYDESGRVICTVEGTVSPPGDYIEVAYQDLGDLGDWIVADGQMARPPGWSAIQADRAGMPPLTAVQLLIGLVTEGWISEAEGDAWVDGILPPSVEALIAQLPPAERFDARTRAKRFSTVTRIDPLVLMLAAAEGRSPEDLDEFFTTWAQV